MRRFPLKIEKKLQNRVQQNSFRTLGSKNHLIDLTSNDYLGFSTSFDIFEEALAILKEKNLFENGSTGSRLLSGNHELYNLAEDKIADFHHAEAALIFNSGYDANIGFFGSIPQRGDVVLYDELVHASIRDGISLSPAKAYKFHHNDLKDLEEKLLRLKTDTAELYIVTEAVFSMDGDAPDLESLVELSEKLEAQLVLDEAHSFGVEGSTGKGVVSEKGLENRVFGRIVTFGKAMGAHGAAVLGSTVLKNYLVNFSRCFIYTTALPPHALATILAAYEHLERGGKQEIEKLHNNILFFISEVKKHGLQNNFIPSSSAIHTCIVPGNEEVKVLSNNLKEQGYDVKPILSPTVPAGKERLRFCLHSFNSSEEISGALSLLAKELQK